MIWFEMIFETVFAALAGYLILHERFTPRDLFGCALMFTGLIVVQLPLLLASPARGSALDANFTTTGELRPIWSSAFRRVREIGRASCRERV